MDQQQPPKLNASQRLDDLEHAMATFYTSFNNLAADVQTIKEAVKLLGNKVDSIVQAMNRGLAVNDETVSQIMVENNVQTLKNAVSSLIEQKVLIPAEEVSMTSFIVAQEVEDDGKVIQPRTQFAVAALPPDLQPKVLGAKAGDVLDLQPGKLKLSIMEVYAVQTPSEPTQEA